MEITINPANSDIVNNLINIIGFIIPAVVAIFVANKTIKAQFQENLRIEKEEQQENISLFLHAIKCELKIIDKLMKDEIDLNNNNYAPEQDYLDVYHKNLGLIGSIRNEFLAEQIINTYKYLKIFLDTLSRDAIHNEQILRLDDFILRTWHIHLLKRELENKGIPTTQEFRELVERQENLCSRRYQEHEDEKKNYKIILKDMIDNNSKAINLTIESINEELKNLKAS